MYFDSTDALIFVLHHLVLNRAVQTSSLIYWYQIHTAPLSWSWLT